MLLARLTVQKIAAVLNQRNLARRECLDVRARHAPAVADKVRVGSRIPRAKHKAVAKQPREFVNIRLFADRTPHADGRVFRQFQRPQRGLQSIWPRRQIRELGAEILGQRRIDRHELLLFPIQIRRCKRIQRDLRSHVFRRRPEQDRIGLRAVLLKIVLQVGTETDPHIEIFVF